MQKWERMLVQLGGSEYEAEIDCESGQPIGTREELLAKGGAPRFVLKTAERNELLAVVGMAVPRKS